MPHTVLFKLFQSVVIVGVTVEIIFYPGAILLSYIWYKIALFLSRRSSDKFHGPVTSGVGTFLAPDNLTRPNATLVHVAVLESTPTLSKVTNHFQRLYDLRNGKDGGRRYAKLGCYPRPWFGYLFWREIENFRIQDQLQFVRQKGEVDVSSFVESLIRKPFLKGEPLWDIYIVSSENSNPDPCPGYSDPCPCFVIFRAHHLLLDGISIVKFWYAMDALDKSSPGEGAGVLPETLFKYGASSSSEKDGSFSSLSRFMRRWALVLCQSPYLGNKFLYTPGDDNCITKNYKNLKGPWYCSGPNRVDLTKYRQPLRKLQFSLTHALIVGYERGLKRFINENYGEKSIPKRVHILGSIPRPNYPRDEDLTNHWAIMRYKADLTCTTVIQQLENAKKEYTRAVHDFVPEAFELSHNLGLEKIPVKIYKFFWDTEKTGTLSLSNIPGPTEKQKMFNIPVSQRAMWLPLTRHNSGIGLLFLTYNGYGTICITADSGCIKSRKQFNHLNQCIVEEFQYVLDHVLEDSLAEKVDANMNILVEPSSNGLYLQEVKVV